MTAQLGLFDAPAPAAPRGGGMPAGVRARFELAFSEPVKLELVARLAERPGQWLRWADFDDIRERHQIGFCLGHVLSSLVRDRRALEQVIYYGAKDTQVPGAYQGFGHIWSTVEHGPSLPWTRKPRP
jgi:hypothetical protein